MSKITPKLLADLRGLTEVNNHCEAYILAASALALPELQAKFEVMLSLQERQGYLDPVQAHQRHTLYQELMTAAKFQLEPALYRQFHMCF